MKTKWLAIGISTVSVIILILTSLSNVVGYQSVQTSQQNRIKERINQRELLFQAICDIANNKEIQRIILKSQMMTGNYLDSNAKLPTPVTKQQLRQMYFIGLILSKIINKSRMQSIVQQYLLLSKKMLHSTQK
jgi:heme exporter protein D